MATVSKERSPLVHPELLPLLRRRIRQQYEIDDPDGMLGNASEDYFKNALEDLRSHHLVIGYIHSPKFSINDLNHIDFIVVDKKNRPSFFQIKTIPFEAFKYRLDLYCNKPKIFALSVLDHQDRLLPLDFLEECILRWQDRPDRGYFHFWNTVEKTRE